LFITTVSHEETEENIKADILNKRDGRSLGKGSNMQKLLWLTATLKKGKCFENMDEGLKLVLKDYINACICHFIQK